MSQIIGGLTGGGVIGGATVRLFLDDKQYQQGLARAETTTKTATTGAQKTTGSFSQFAVLAWAAAGAAVLKFAADSVAAYEESAAVQAQLEGQIGGNTQALQDQADALQYLTGVQDEQILSADIVLSRFKLTQGEIEEAIPLVLDYAKAQGVDAETAAQAFGKALLGNTRALKGVGGELTVTGNRTKDFTALVGILQNKVGGAATDLSIAEQRSIEMRISIEELKEGIGKLILDGVGPLIGDLADLAHSIESVTGGLGSGGEGGGGLTAGTLLGALAFGAMQRGLKGVNEILVQFDNIMGGIGTTVTPATGAVEDLQKRMAALGIRSAKTGRQIAVFAQMTGDELQSWKDSTSEAFNTASDVWDKLADKARVSSRRILLAFKEQNRALGDYQENLEEAKSKGASDELLKSLAEMGLEGAVILKGLADSSKKEIGQVNDVFDTNQRHADMITQGFVNTKEALEAIDRTRSAALVSVKYVIDPTGINPAALPGVGGQT